MSLEIMTAKTKSRANDSFYQEKVQCLGGGSPPAWFVSDIDIILKASKITSKEEVDGVLLRLDASLCGHRFRVISIKNRLYEILTVLRYSDTLVFQKEYLKEFVVSLQNIASSDYWDIDIRSCVANILFYLYKAKDDSHCVKLPMVDGRFIDHWGLSRNDIVEIAKIVFLNDDFGLYTQNLFERIFK